MMLYNKQIDIYHRDIDFLSPILVFELYQ